MISVSLPTDNSDTFSNQDEENEHLSNHLLA